MRERGEGSRGRTSAGVLDGGERARLAGRSKSTGSSSRCRFKCLRGAAALRRLESSAVFRFSVRVIQPRAPGDGEVFDRDSFLAHARKHQLGGEGELVERVKAVRN